MAKHKKPPEQVSEGPTTAATGNWNASEHRAPRFFVPDTLSPGAEFRLSERAARHVAVLRLREGEPITLFNGEGGEYRAVLTGLARDRITTRILERINIERESPLAITLAQCVSAGDRMDFVLQKATELGASHIIPIVSERSIVRVSGERAERKLEHWRNVVIAACEQCGRNRPPEIPPMAELHSWLAGLPTSGSQGARLLLAPDGVDGASSLARETQVTLLVGPEGGLAAQERAAAERAGFKPVRLGPRVLRTETAPLAALAMLQTLWGDFG